MHSMPSHAVLALVLPLVSAAIIALFLRRRGTAAAAVSVTAAVGIASLALILALHKERFLCSVEWLRFGDFAVSLGFRFDDLAALMLCIVGVVGLCVHVFSLDRKSTRLNSSHRT